MKHRRDGFTVFEVLGLIALYVFVAGLLIHTVHKVHVAAGHSACKAHLAAALDSWKKGLSPNPLRHASPARAVRDPAWKSGRRLVAYRIAECTGGGSDWRCAVELTLRDRDGRTVRRIVTYRVSLEPVVRICRDAAGPDERAGAARLRADARRAAK
jgi:hypothetical protein